MPGVDDASLLARAVRAALATRPDSDGHGPGLVVDLFTAPRVADLGEDHAFAVAEAVLAAPGWSRHGSGGARLVTCTRSTTIGAYLREHLRDHVRDHVRIETAGVGDRLTVLDGDPTVTVPVHLRRLAASDPGSRAAHSIALVDPYGMDIPWPFYASIAPFRRASEVGDADRVELWLYLGEAFQPPTQAQHRSGTITHASQVERMMGDDPRWFELIEAGLSGALDPFHHQAELLNLIRWKLQTELGYAQTTVHRFPSSGRRSLPPALVIAAAGRSWPHLAAVADVFAAARDGSPMGARVPAKPSRPRKPTIVSQRVNGA